MIDFKAVSGKMPILPDAVVKDLSRDQYLAYQWGHAFQDGEVSDSLAGQVIGPLNNSRWLTRSIRTLAEYARTKRPTKKFQRIVFFILNFYLPGWFRIKSKPHCQDGARHLQYLLELSRDLCADDQEIVKSVMQDNGHWAHPENIVIACLSDQDWETRKKGVDYIRQARLEDTAKDDVRKFVPPEINMQSKKFYDLVDLETAEKTEPPVTKHLSDETISSALTAPLILPAFPNNTQSVERAVRVVTKVAKKRAGHTARHKLILQKLLSRKRVSKFDSKKDERRALVRKTGD